MSAIYSKAPGEVIEKARALIEKNHFDLHNNSVRIDFIFANSTLNDDGVPVGPALKHNGYAALGLTRILGPKERLMERGDCEIVIDGDRWPNLSTEKQDALIDHELEHLQPKFTKTGDVVTDDLNRPKLKLRKHDHQFGWFDNVARRHGKESIEVNQFKALCESEQGQLYFPFVSLESIKRIADSMKDTNP
jgi:hypothetical protein